MLRCITLFPLVLLVWAAGLGFFLGVAFHWVVYPMMGESWAIAPDGSATAVGAVVIVLVVLAWTVVFSVATWRYGVRRGGFTVLRGSHGRSKAEKLLRAVRQGKKSVGIGVIVLKCEYEEESWKPVVDAALGQARVAIVDLSEPTKFLLWELGRALDHLGEHGVIVTAEEGIDIDAVIAQADGDGDLTTEAGRIVRGEWIRSNLVTYPAAEHPTGAPRIRSLFARMEYEADLRLEIAERLARTRADTRWINHVRRHRQTDTKM